MTKKTNVRVRSSKEAADSPLSGLKSVSLLLKIVVVVAAIVFAYIVTKQSQTAIIDLVNVNEKALKDAIFGDVPHLFYCDRGSTTKNIPALFTDLHHVRGSKMSFAVLNCSQVLPSGKSIYDRFKLKKEWKPTIWGTAPWAPTLQAGPTHMKDVNALKKFVDDHFSPKAQVVKSTKQLNKLCGFDRKKAAAPTSDDGTELGQTCIVVSKGGRFGKSQQGLEEHLVSAFPRTKFVSVDAAKLRLSFESADDVPADAFSMRLHALRNATHYLSMVNSPTWDYLHTFVSTSVGSDVADFMTDKHQAIALVAPGQKADKPKTKKTSKKKPAKVVDELNEEETHMREQQREQQAQQAKQEQAKEASAKILEAAAKAEAERKRRERERQIREEMDRMEREHLFEGGSTDEDEDAADESEGDAEAVDEDEETIEL